MASNASYIDIWTTPYLAPPPGVVSNFVNPESRGPMVRAGMYSILPIMLVFVLLRMYTRVRVMRSFGTDDYLCLLSTAHIITYSALVLSFMDKPEGRHGWDIPLGQILDNHYWLEATLASLFVYTLGNLFTKLTLLFLYLRVFRPSVWARTAIWIGIITTTIVYIGTFISYAALCTRSGSPLWESMTDLRCGNGSLVVSKVQGCYGLISDVYILLIPLSLVTRLQLTLRRKLVVLAVFMVGLAAIAIAAMALAKRYEAVEQGADRTWINSIIFLYGTLELAIGLICSCMPVIGVTLKNSATQLDSMWTSLVSYGTELMSRNSRQGSVDSRSKEQLPDNPHENVSGPSSFIHRFRHANKSNIGEASLPITVGTIESVDQSYHYQLKQMNNRSTGV